MRRTTAIAWMGGILTGIAITAATATLQGRPLGEPVQLLLLHNVVPVTVCTGVTLAVLRRWLARHSAEARREQVNSAQQRADFQKAMKKREDDLARREESVNRTAVVAQVRISQTLQALVDEKAVNDALRAEYDELAEEYNRVVVDALQQSADLFRPRATAAEPAEFVAAAPLITMPGRPRALSDATHGRACDVADPYLA